jgi:ubiquinone/menaquinone biosynthesis C-methylase UbiE
MNAEAPRQLDLTRQNYDRLAPWYDLVAGAFEWPLARRGLEALGLKPGERVLELGHGTGRALVELARAVGPGGRVLGADLSPGMAQVALRRLRDEGLADRVELVTGDALALELPAASLDAAFSAFTLETFPEGAALELLARVRVALRPGGRLALVSMASGGGGAMSALYAWSHRRFPQLVDCAPIDATALLREAGFAEVASDRHHLAGIAVAVTRARTPA